MTRLLKPFRRPRNVEAPPELDDLTSATVKVWFDASALKACPDTFIPLVVKQFAMNAEAYLRHEYGGAA
jgi:hypothetical protein